MCWAKASTKAVERWNFAPTFLAISSGRSALIKTIYFKFKSMWEERYITPMLISNHIIITLDLAYCKGNTLMWGVYSSNILKKFLLPLFSTWKPSPWVNATVISYTIFHVKLLHCKWHWFCIYFVPANNHMHNSENLCKW